jgi:hypothetical protein
MNEYDQLLFDSHMINYGLGVEDGPQDEFEQAQELCSLTDVGDDDEPSIYDDLEW